MKALSFFMSVAVLFGASSMNAQKAAPATTSSKTASAAKPASSKAKSTKAKTPAKPATAAAKPATELKAATPQQPWVQKASETVKTEWEKIENDFGNIPQGIPATAKFKFKNTGTTPVTLKDVKASCGCTAPNWPKEPVMPGETSVIEATYNAASPNQFQKNVTVTVEGIAEPIILTIKGNVNPKDAAAPTPATGGGK